MMKLKIKKASCRVEFDYVLRGSVLKATVNTTWEGVKTHIEVESIEPSEKIAALVRIAKGGCFAENMITQAVPLTSEVKLNGEALEIKGITPEG